MYGDVSLQSKVVSFPGNLRAWELVASFRGSVGEISVTKGGGGVARVPCHLFVGSFNRCTTVGYFDCALIISTEVHVLRVTGCIKVINYLSQKHSRLKIF